MSFWDHIRARVRTRIREEGVENFHKWPEIAQTMNIGRPDYLPTEIALCRASKYFNLVGEDDGSWAWPNLIHQLCHIVRYEEYTKRAITSFDSFVEVGGGMGCMRKVVHLIHPNADYTIIDLPEIQEIQKFYLRGVPTNFLYKTDNVTRDVLISCWALTEIEDLELREDFLPLGRHLLIAGQSRWETIDNVKWLMERSQGFSFKPIHHLNTGNFYFFT